jgi:hypothetical protein
MDAQACRAWITSATRVIDVNRDHLTLLDAASAPPITGSTWPAASSQWSVRSKPGTRGQHHS